MGLQRKNPQQLTSHQIKQSFYSEWFTIIPNNLSVYQLGEEVSIYGIYLKILFVDTFFRFSTHTFLPSHMHFLIICKTTSCILIDEIARTWNTVINKFLPYVHGRMTSFVILFKWPPNKPAGQIESTPSEGGGANVNPFTWNKNLICMDFPGNPVRISKWISNASTGSLAPLPRPGASVYLDACTWPNYPGLW